MYHHHETAKRRTALVAGAVLCASQAIDYLTQQPQPAVAAAAWGGYLIPTYGLTWLAVGVLCLGHLPSGRLVTPIAALSALLAGWGTVWLLGGLLGDPTDIRTLKTGAVYFGIALLLSALLGLTPKTTPKGVRDA